MKDELLTRRFEVPARCPVCSRYADGWTELRRAVDERVAPPKPDLSAVPCGCSLREVHLNQDKVRDPGHRRP